MLPPGHSRHAWWRRTSARCRRVLAPLDEPPRWSDAGVESDRVVRRGTARRDSVLNRSTSSLRRQRRHVTSSLYKWCIPRSDSQHLGDRRVLACPAGPCSGCSGLQCVDEARRRAPGRAAAPPVGRRWSGVVRHHARDERRDERVVVRAAVLAEQVRQQRRRRSARRGRRAVRNSDLRRGGLAPCRTVCRRSAWMELAKTMRGRTVRCRRTASPTVCASATLPARPPRRSPRLTPARWITASASARVRRQTGPAPRGRSRTTSWSVSRPQAHPECASRGSRARPVTTTFISGAGRHRSRSPGWSRAAALASLDVQPLGVVRGVVVARPRASASPSSKYSSYLRDAGVQRHPEVVALVLALHHLLAAQQGLVQLLAVAGADHLDLRLAVAEQPGDGRASTSTVQAGALRTNRSPGRRARTRARPAPPTRPATSGSGSSSGR